MDFLMEGFRAGDKLFPCVSLCKENTASTSRQTAKLRRHLQVLPPGDEREKEHREATLAIWPVSTTHTLLFLDVHFTHKAAFKFVN